MQPLTNSQSVLIKIMMNDIKEWIAASYKRILGVGAIVSGISYGLSDLMSFPRLFFLLVSLYLVYSFIVANNTKTDKTIQEREEEITKKYEEYVSVCEKTIDEQFNTIKNYEEIFDLQVSSIPCNCGNNTFEGIFIPNDENICECEKCKGVYRVSVNFDVVLISTPMDSSND